MPRIMRDPGDVRNLSLVLSYPGDIVACWPSIQGTAMPSFRDFMFALFLGLAAPVAAQTNEGEVVVIAATDAKSDWLRAETRHLVVTSNGSRDQLVRVTRRLEQLHRLMSRIYRAGERRDDTLRLQVVLLSEDRSVGAFDRQPAFNEEGPYAAGFAPRRHYDPRDDGELLVVVRKDQVLDLNTPRRFNDDCDTYLANAGPDAGTCMKSLPQYLPVTRPWEATLYSAFAQRFLLTYLPAPYPRWYLDGVGAMFSTIAERRHDVIDYAQAPGGHRDIYRSYGVIKVPDILQGSYLTGSDGKTAWTPYHAWLMAHFFLFSDAGRKWATPFQAYMLAVRQGRPLAAAAAAFTDMKGLQQAVIRHAEANEAYAPTAPTPLAPEDEPLVTALSATSAALVEAQVAIGSGSADRWLPRVQAILGRLPQDAATLTFSAEAECRANHAAECLSAATAALDRSPDDIVALTWKGVALTDLAIAGPAAGRADALATARRALEQATARDRRAPMPAIAYFQSFTKAGERVPAPAMLGMVQVIQAIPAAPGPRLYLGEELLRQGQAETARRLLFTTVNSPYDSPERRAARQLLGTSATGG